MSEAVFGSCHDQNPILATGGLRSCIGFAGWEPEKKIAFLVHFSGPDQVADFYSRGFEILSEKTGYQKSTFRCSLKGGCEKTRFSKQIVDLIKKGLHSHPEIELEILFEEPLSKSFTLTSLSVDSRNGVFGEYDRESDPFPRQMSKQEQERYTTFDATETLAYR